MNFTSHQHLGAVLERRFMIGDAHGLLWTPDTATPARPAPVVLAGQPGANISMNDLYPRLATRAQRAAQRGLATITLELPGAGDRPHPAGVDEARRELRRAVHTGQVVPDDLATRLVQPVVDQAVPEWQEALDQVETLPELSDRFGVSGGLVALGVRLALVEPRVVAAVLFAGSYFPRAVLDEARQVTVPTHVLLQWDDEGNDRQAALDLYDALGSSEKTLTANLGGHSGVPTHAGDASNDFLNRHLHTTPDHP